MMGKHQHTACPCGGADFALCCGLYIEQGHPAPTSEALMRSRYSAYVLGDEAYLQATWHPSTRPTEAILGDDSNIKWTRLDVRTHAWEEGAEVAQVEFVALYKVQGRAHKLHEVSDFVREDGCWFYVEGIYPESSQ
jgi:SEC-C motif-containing protein